MWNPFRGNSVSVQSEPTTLVHKPASKTFTWTLWAFVAAFAVIVAMLVWQLEVMNPVRWCAMANSTSDNSNACVTLLLENLKVHGNAVYGLLGILSIIVISIVVVALKVKVNVSASKTGLDLGVTQNADGTASAVAKTDEQIVSATTAPAEPAPPLSDLESEQAG